MRRLACPNDEAAVTALNRLAFGPRHGDVARVSKIGVSSWIDQQLEARIANGPLDGRLARLQTLTFDSATIGRMFFERGNSVRHSSGPPPETLR